jgi:hypothetical protein
MVRRFIVCIIAAIALAKFPDCDGRALAGSAIAAGAVDCSFACRLREATIHGEIDQSTMDTITHLIDQTKEQGRRENKPISFVDGVDLDSLGGDVAAAMAIGKLFRKERVWVSVSHGSVCYSACVLILAGAVHRAVAGKVGIHRPYFEVPKQQITADSVTGLYQQTLQNIRSYFREMNVSEQLADDMLRIEPKDMRLIFAGVDSSLDYSVLHRYGLTPTDPIEQETQDLQDAQFLGVTRQEYMKRRALGERSCPTVIGGEVDKGSSCYQSVMKTGRPPVPARQLPGRVDANSPACRVCLQKSGGCEDIRCYGTCVAGCDPQ